MQENATLGIQAFSKGIDQKAGSAKESQKRRVSVQLAGDRPCGLDRPSTGSGRGAAWELLRGEFCHPPRVGTSPTLDAARLGLRFPHPRSGGGGPRVARWRGLSAWASSIATAIRTTPSATSSGARNTSAAAIRVTVTPCASIHASRRMSRCGRSFVDHAVDLDGEPRPRAIEVEHVRSDRMLSPKRWRFGLSGAQAGPQHRFRRRKIAPKPAGGGDCLWRGSHSRRPRPPPPRFRAVPLPRFAGEEKHLRMQLPLTPPPPSAPLPPARPRRSG